MANDSHSTALTGDLLELAAIDQAAAEQDARYRQALDRAMHLLAQREHSVSELTGKLRSKGIDADLAALVVDDLRGRGLQSDARFTESFVHSRVGRAQGPIRIREELRQRGIADDLADEMLTESGEYWLELARATREKKFGEAPPADRDAWGRQARFLARRGFPSDLIYRVLESARD
jgi:regulatory protein